MQYSQYPVDDDAWKSFHPRGTLLVGTDLRLGARCVFLGQVGLCRLVCSQEHIFVSADRAGVSTPDQTVLLFAVTCFFGQRLAASYDLPVSLSEPFLEGSSASEYCVLF